MKLATIGTFCVLFLVCVCARFFATLSTKKNIRRQELVVGLLLLLVTDDILGWVAAAAADAVSVQPSLHDCVRNGYGVFHLFISELRFFVCEFYIHYF